MSAPFPASLPSLPNLVSHVRNSHPFLSSLLPPFFCHYPAQPILKIKDLSVVVALMRVRKMEKAVHLRGLNHFFLKIFIG